MPLVSAVAVVLLHELEEVGLLALLVPRGAPRLPSRRGRRRPPCSPGARRGSLAPPRLTTMWPISPGRAAARARACRRGSGRRRRRCPRRRRAELVELAPAPSWNSASVATWTSLPIRTSVPSASASVSAEREAALPAGQVAAPRRRRRSSRRRRPASRPRRPPARSVSTPAPSAASRSAVRHRVARRRRGRPSVGVGWRASPQHLAVGVDDRRLDLGPAEVDAAAERVLTGGGLHRPRVYSERAAVSVGPSAGRSRASPAPAARGGCRATGSSPDRRLVWVGSPVVCAARGEV